MMMIKQVQWISFNTTKSCFATSLLLLLYFDYHLCYIFSIYSILSEIFQSQRVVPE